MVKGLESFLKRIRQDPSNETYVERFLVLLEDEEPANRLTYYRKLFDLLINFKPITALDVAYQELKVSRELAFVRDQIKSLERIERCFLALERPGKAEVVRNEIDALRVRMIESPLKKPLPDGYLPNKTKISRPIADGTKISHLPAPPKQVSPLPEEGFSPDKLPDLGKFGLNEGQVEDQVGATVQLDLPGEPSIPKLIRPKGAPSEPPLAEEINWSIFFDRLFEEVDRWSGNRLGQIDQWLERQHFDWSLERRRQASKLLDKALKNHDPRCQIDFVSFFLLHCSLPQLDTFLQQLSFPCLPRQLWLAATKELLAQNRARKAHHLLQKFCDQALSQGDSTYVVSYANEARWELGWQRLTWQPKDGLGKLREMMLRRPEPGLRHIFIG